MRPSNFLSLLTVSALGLLTSAEDLQIETLHKVESCDRRTKTGDTVQLHYRGTLASDGSEFDASYKRNKPLEFKIGAGMVIEGCVVISLLFLCLSFWLLSAAVVAD